MSPNAPSSGYYELARAVAFANLPLDEPRILARLTSQNPDSKPSGLCAHEGFVREIARALRYPGSLVPARTLSELRHTVHWFRVLRPLYGFRTAKDLVEAQRRIQQLLDAIIRGSDGGGATAPTAGALLMQQARRLTLWLDVETLTPRR